jgi:hypothetical protein
MCSTNMSQAKTRPLYFRPLYFYYFYCLQIMQVTELVEETSVVNKQVQLSRFALFCGMFLHRSAFPLLSQDVYVSLAKGTPMAELKTSAHSEIPLPITCSALRLQLPCRFPIVLPSDTSPHRHRLPALRLLWLLLKTLCP